MHITVNKKWIFPIFWFDESEKIAIVSGCIKTLMGKNSNYNPYPDPSDMRSAAWVCGKYLNEQENN